MDRLTIVGAKHHNLKNLTLTLPRHQLVVITGPSGSGKSSLAFDTIYAEGQRRYVESLSAYARQFLEQLPKPDVESIEGLSPAIAIEQKGLGKNPRSTVGTVTEITDYLRLAFARLGVAHCPITGEVLRAHTPQEIVDHLLGAPEGARLTILAPLPRQGEADVTAQLETLRREGFVRARLDGVDVDLAAAPPPMTEGEHALEVVVDRVVARPSSRVRITDSVELALKLGGGTILVDRHDGNPPQALSERVISWEHGIVFPAVQPRLFSFNSPHGACPACHGLGKVTRIDPDRLAPDPSRSLREGALPPLGRRGSPRLATEVSRLHKALGVDIDVPWGSLPADQRNAILHGTGPEKRPGYAGLIQSLELRLAASGDEAEGGDEGRDDPAAPDDLGRYLVDKPCEQCQGTRLRAEASWVRLRGATIAELSNLPLSELRVRCQHWLDTPEEFGPNKALAAPVLRPVVERLGFLEAVGLDYLCLDRPAQSLSGGEGQRIRLATQIGAALVGVLYVLDEPSVGLHARDTEQLIAAMRRLVTRGNSVIVVEHDRDTMLAADHLVDMGPVAGKAGGHVVAAGTPREVMSHANSATGAYLRGERQLPAHAKAIGKGQTWLRVRNARAHNLKGVTAELPLGRLSAITGVSGAGKSALIVDTLLAAARAHFYGAGGPIGPHDGIEGFDALDKVVSLDQAPLGRTPRSNPATYSGIFTLLRELFAGLPDARARGYKAGRFSFNVKGGRCEACQGDGVKRVEMHFLPDAYVQCEVCAGMRYNRETLEIKYKGLSIAEVLALTVDDALGILDAIPRLQERLQALRQIGLGYLQLGQPATTLSGGEAQRVKLATELSKTSTGKTLYVLDEPTTGLHFSDIEVLLEGLIRLRDAGNTLVLIEHNLDLVACADWVIDLGQGGGATGGEIVAVGTPEQVARDPRSVTGPYLRRALEERSRPRATN